MLEDPAAMGFTVESGWASAVLMGGPARSPGVLAAQRLELPEPELRRRLANLGRPVAGPWRAEQKCAALAAWLVLAGSAAPRSG